MEVNLIPLSVNNQPAQGISAKWQDGQFVLIVAEKGIVACGIVNCEVMEKFGAAIAIARGTPEKPLATPDDLLSAKICDVTEKAKEYGIKVGMSGREALEKMCLS